MTLARAVFADMALLHARSAATESSPCGKSNIRTEDG